jgi:hypothetical protein
MELLCYEQNWAIDGVDIYLDYIQKAKKRGIYRKIFVGDVIKVARQIQQNKKNKYDCVFCSQLIEHIGNKKGEKLLNSFEKIAGQRIIVTTPIGFIKQQEAAIEENPFQEHKSGWSTNYFKKRGYRIIGVGPKWLWHRTKLIDVSPPILLWFFSFVSFLFSGIYYFLPEYAAAMICVKDK